MRQNIFNAIFAVMLLIMWYTAPSVEKHDPPLEKHLMPLPEGKWSESYDSTLEALQTYNIFLLRSVVRENIQRLEALEKSDPNSPQWPEDPNT